jgi:hypothetical protein
MDDHCVGSAGPGWGARSRHCAQKDYARALGEHLIGYGHIVSDDASATLATTWFVQLDDRAAAEAFVANDPLSRAGRLADLSLGVRRLSAMRQ